MTTNGHSAAILRMRSKHASLAGEPWLRTAVAGLLLLALISPALVPPAASAAVEKPAAKTDDDGRLAAFGRVLLPGGAPAAGAVVWAVNGDRADGVAQVQADRKGEFRLRHAFDWGASLNARSDDWRLQASIAVPRDKAREMFARPVEIRLKPAREQVVSVTFQGKPVADASVMAVEQLNGKIPARTDHDGQARLWLPADVKLRTIVAFHPSFGAGGFGFDDTNALPPQGVLSLAIQPAQPHKIRVVDGQGQPVPDLELAVTCNVAGWIAAGEIDGTHVRTDARGEALVPWMPRGAKYVNISLADPRWKLDRFDRKDQETAITVLRKYPVSGRLVLPSGVDVEGVLIVGNGIGPMVGNGMFNGDSPAARARRDGSFTLLVAPNHGYSVEVVDSAWASTGWTGLILADEKAKPPEIQLSAQPATKLSIHVTRGPQHQPVAGAWIFMRVFKPFTWKDASGQHQNHSGGTAFGAETDQNGTAQFAVGKGEWNVSMTSGKWWEQRKVEVAWDRPASVDFDRPWNDKRTITGRLTLQGKPHPRGPATVVRAWSTKQPEIGGTGTVQADGRFSVDIDAQDVYVFAVDRREHVSGGRSAGSSTSTLDLDLVPMGSASGVVVDKADEPLGGRRVELVFKGPEFMDMVVIDSTTTDEKGRFRLDAVPSQRPVSLYSGEPASARSAALTKRTNEFHIDAIDSIYLDTAEKRQGVRLVADLSSSTESAATRPAARKTTVPLEPQLKRLTRDARLAGMRVLVVLEGDASKSVERMSTQVVDYEDLPDVLRYLTATLGAEALKREAGLLARLGWERPKPGEIELVALDGTGATLASTRIDARDATPPRNEAARQEAARFLRQNAPPRRDARAALAAAQDEARETGRRLVVVAGGPRCGPCFRFARWLDEQHALLLKDYVIVKILEGVDERAKEVVGKLNPPRGAGIPWFAITEPDGTILATSDGPLGNMGCPSSPEDKKHLQKMLDRTARRLSPAERERLIESLGGN
jgi:hypothetical protein